MAYFWVVTNECRRWIEEKKNELMLLRWPLPLGAHAGDLPALANCRVVSLDDWIGRFGSGWKERQLGWATGLELSTLNLACLLSFVFVFWPNGTHLRQPKGTPLAGSPRG
jgi:hypothetical protein